MANLDDFSKLACQERGLVVIATTRADGSVQATVVNAGVLPHPDGGEVVGLVARGNALKLRLLRRRSGRRYRTLRLAVGDGGGSRRAGRARRPSSVFDDIPRLLRDVFTAAGGTHDDWATYDRVMAEERRTAVLVRPERIYGVS
jgi:hypothetical protein